MVTVNYPSTNRILFGIIMIIGCRHVTHRARARVRVYQCEKRVAVCRSRLINSSHSTMSTSSGTTSEMLFACTNCHKRCKFEDLSSSQQLCKGCRKQFPLVTCTYCRLEFHPIKNATDRDSRPACEHCSRDFKQYGTPSFCSICNLQSAFNGKRCSRCTHSEKKYGPPIECDHCKLVCAFEKPDDIKRKVDGRTLCLLCTINYKKAQFKKRTHEQKSGKPSHASSSTSSQSSSVKRYHQQQHSSAKHTLRHKDKDKEPALKKLKVEKTLSIPDALPITHSLSLLRDSQPLDVLSSNHMLETNKLQNEIASLKKQLAQKEQALIEKDKQICSLRAEVLEKDKEFRVKLQTLQKTHSETVEQLQTDIRTVKKQLVQTNPKKTSSSTQNSINSSLASLASSLAATPNSTSSSRDEKD